MILRQKEGSRTPDMGSASYLKGCRDNSCLPFSHDVSMEFFPSQILLGKMGLNIMLLVQKQFMQGIILPFQKV